MDQDSSAYPAGESANGPLDVPGSLLDVDRKKISIVGKDWLNVAEAAFYCGVSESQFRKNALTYGLTPRRFMGKQLYEKSALYQAIWNSPTWR